MSTPKPSKPITAGPDPGTWPHYHAYGVTIASQFRFETPLASSNQPADVTFTWGDQDPTCIDPQQAHLVYEGTPTGPEAEPELALLEGPGYQVLRIAGVAEFTLGPAQIHCKLLDPAQPHAVEINLLGMVLAYWLEKAGRLALHASAVAVDGQGVLFFGGHGGGKSTLAGLMMQHGHPLLSDDIVPVVRGETGYLAQPSFPQMRLWPRQAAYFLGERHVGLARAHPRFAKRRVSVGPAGFGQYADAAVPIKAIYLADERADPEDPTVRIDPMSPGQATIELIRHSFVPNLIAATGSPQERLKAVTGVVAQTYPRRINYPRGAEYLIEVQSALEADLASLGLTR